MIRSLRMPPRSPVFNAFTYAAQRGKPGALSVSCRTGPSRAFCPRRIYTIRINFTIICVLFKCKLSAASLWRRRLCLLRTYGFLIALGGRRRRIAFVRCAAYGRRPLPPRITHNRHWQHAAARLHMRPAVRALLQTARLRNLAAPCTSELSYTKRTANAGSLPLGLHRLRPCAFYLPAGPIFLLPWPV